ncbi:MAG: hypothetical protein EKK40_10430 [Bradyrhizobiaceae bacterium]|nr:MAG: hypothetical protein EKK40_10430 [Bradyrhizobiaceae bacterium]
MVGLPEGVTAVKTKRATYYYWHPHRGTDRAGKRIPLGKDPTDPEFWNKLKEVRGFCEKSAEGTFNRLVDDYLASKSFERRRPRTQENYRLHLERIKEAWGTMQVSGLTVAGIYALRAQYEATPVAANHLVSVLRTLLKWGLQHGYGTTNPAREIEPIQIEDEENAKPWPEWVYDFIVKNAPEDIRRGTILGRACGQRISDWVKFGKKNRKDDGIAIKIGKLRDKDHIIPLMKHQLAELDSWSCSDTGPWVISVANRTMTADAWRAALNRYIARTPELKSAEIAPHGLRAMAAIDRKMAGGENRAIGANLRMSTQIVERYIRHIDELKLARGVRDQMEDFARAGKV